MKNQQITDSFWVILIFALICPISITSTLIGMANVPLHNLNLYLINIAMIIVIGRLKRPYNSKNTQLSNITLSDLKSDITGFGYRTLLLTIVFIVIEIFNRVTDSRQSGLAVYVISVIYFFILNLLELSVSYGRAISVSDKEG